MEFWSEYCTNIYQIPKMFPDDKRWNMRYGGKDLKATKVIYTNGIEDPWQHASIIDKADDPDNVYIMIDCDDCSHCMDLRVASDNDDPALTAARAQILDQIDEWWAEELKPEK